MIVAGFGFSSRATQDSLLDALRLTGHAEAVTLFATADDKTPMLADLAKTMGCHVSGIAPDALSDAEVVTRSAVSQEARQTGSVAEAAALAAAGPDARLIVSRRISTDKLATCAIAQGGRS